MLEWMNFVSLVVATVAFMILFAVSLTPAARAEKDLEIRFGAHYQEYKRKTGAFFPKFPSLY